MEALDEAVLPGSAWRDEHRPHVLLSQPPYGRRGNKFGAVVVAQYCSLPWMRMSREKVDDFLRSDPSMHLDR
jgi:hypothetical protein